MKGADVLLWTNGRVTEWLRLVDLAEYAPNLRGSGVHGALMVRKTSNNQPKHTERNNLVVNYVVVVVLAAVVAMVAAWRQQHSGGGDGGD